MQNFEVDFFKKKDGSCPVRDFILSLDKKMRAKVYRELDLLEEYGYELREPHSKAIEDGIFELRAKQGSNITRILYFFIIDKKIILTNGFVKKTQSLPAKELQIAKKFREDYLNRKVD